MQKSLWRDALLWLVSVPRSHMCILILALPLRASWALCSEYTTMLRANS